MKKYIAIILSVMLLGGCGLFGDNVPTSGEQFAGQAKEDVKSVTISCAGDCTLGTDAAFGGVTFPVEVKNQNNDFGWFFRNVKPIFEKDDLTIVNFEGTLTTRGVRQDKTFAFKGDPEYTAVLTEGSVEAVTLANNHSMDYGIESLEDTRRYIEEAGIVWFENLTTRIVEKNGIKIGLIGLYDLNGTAPGYLPKTIDEVKQNGAQIIIVQAHWGVEGENYPTKRQKDLAYAAIDAGAHMVIGHHPHVLQGVEEYKGRVIAYSIGNFCFGGNQNPNDKDSMIIQQTFTFKNGVLTEDKDWGIYPCSVSSVSSRNNYQPTPLTGDEGERVKNKIKSFSSSLGNLEIKFYEVN